MTGMQQNAINRKTFCNISCPAKMYELQGGFDSSDFNSIILIKMINTDGAHEVPYATSKTITKIKLYDYIQLEYGRMNINIATLNQQYSHS